MLLRLFGSITLLALVPPWTEGSQPWLTITVSGTRPAGLGSELRGKSRTVVEGRHQGLRAIFFGEEAPQLRLCVEKVASTVQMNGHEIGQMSMQALRVFRQCDLGLPSTGP